MTGLHDEARQKKDTLLTRSRLSLGKRGEDWVAAQLEQSGYTIITRNWRHPELGELDIVARHAEDIVFVEVRTRRGSLDTAAEYALESVNERKRARLLLLAEAYLIDHDLEQESWHIEIAAVGCEGNTLSMKVIEYDW